MAIAAHLADRADRNAAPRDARRKIRLATMSARVTGEDANVVIHNISTSGFLVESDLPIEVGEMFAIDLPDAPDMLASVVWKSEALHGCRFDTPIPSSILRAAQLVGGVEEMPRPSEADFHEDESFGQRVQRLRTKRGLPLSAVANELGVSKPTVWAWEQDRAKPVASRIDALAEVLGVTAHELISGHDDSALSDMLARCRQQIAQAYGVEIRAVKILIEL